MIRVAGLETEYGCLVPAGEDPGIAVCRIRDWIFRNHRYGLIDMHQRDWDEPSGNGGFLYNGGRLYMDMGHLEYCTPECLDLKDLIRYDRAGDRMVHLACKENGLEESLGFIRNNIDHYSGATFGCHENYLVHRNAPLTESTVLSLLAFLTLRAVMVGAGRVSGADLEDPWEADPKPRKEQAHFQISQRANYINNDLFEWVQFNRAIINTRDEPLADGRRFRRLHLLHGDTSVLTETLALKLGSTALVLDLLEKDALPSVYLADAVGTLRALSNQPDGPWEAPLADGRIVPVLDLLEMYRDAAALHFGGRDEETDQVLQLWTRTLEALKSRNWDRLFGSIDWVTKKLLLEQFVEQEKLQWNDPWVKSQDLEFHHTDPARGLGQALDQPSTYWAVNDDNIETALMNPPENTRAKSRGAALKAWGNSPPERYFADWERLDCSQRGHLSLLDPFKPEPDGFSSWLKSNDESSCFH